MMGLAPNESQLTFLVTGVALVFPAKQDVLTSYLRTFGDRSTSIGVIVDLAYQFRQTIDRREISTGGPAVGTSVRMLVARAFTHYERLEEAFVVEHVITFQRFAIHIFQR